MTESVKDLERRTPVSAHQRKRNEAVMNRLRTKAGGYSNQVVRVLVGESMTTAKGWRAAAITRFGEEDWRRVARELPAPFASKLPASLIDRYVADLNGEPMPAGLDVTALSDSDLLDLLDEIAAETRARLR